MGEPLAALIEANIALAAAIALIAMVRMHLRRVFGARLAYALWALPPLAAAATLLPARTITRFIDPAPVASTPVSEALPTTAPAIVETTPPPAPFPTETVLIVLWLAGALALTLWLAARQWRFMQDLRAGKAGPAVVGFFRPRIVRPADFETRFSPREQAVVLAHEKVHLTRQDARINALAAALRCLCWFNPFIHIGAHLMRIDQEMSCDAVVVERHPKARKPYAQALLKAQLAARPLPVGCYWPAGTLHPLTERIVMLDKASPTVMRRLAGGALATLILTGGGIAAWAAQPAKVNIEPAQPKRMNIDRDEARFIQGTITGFDLNGPQAQMLLTEEGTGQAWIAVGGASATANIDLEAMVGQRVIVRGDRLDDGSCNPACTLDARDVTFSVGEQMAFAERQSQNRGSGLIRLDRTDPFTIMGALESVEPGDNGLVLHIRDEGLGMVWLATGPQNTTGLRAMLDARIGERVGAGVNMVSGETCDQTCSVVAREILLPDGSRIYRGQSPTAQALDLPEASIQRTRQDIENGPVEPARSSRAVFEPQPAPARQDAPTGFFHTDNLITLRGEIVSVDWSSPESRLHMRDGATGETWIVVGGAPWDLTAEQRASVRIGAQAVLQAYPARSGCAPTCMAKGQVFRYADGSPLISPPLGAARNRSQPDEHAGLPPRVRAAHVVLEDVRSRHAIGAATESELSASLVQLTLAEVDAGVEPTRADEAVRVARQEIAAAQQRYENGMGTRGDIGRAALDLVSVQSSLGGPVSPETRRLVLSGAEADVLAAEARYENGAGTPREVAMAQARLAMARSMIGE